MESLNKFELLIVIVLFLQIVSILAGNKSSCFWREIDVQFLIRQNFPSELLLAFSPSVRLLTTLVSSAVLKRGSSSPK